MIRGSPAIVAPVTAKTFTLKYFEIDSFLEIAIASERDPSLYKAFRLVLHEAVRTLGKRVDQLPGLFELTNNIEVAGGLGFSAAICVAITQWLVWKKWLPEKNIFNFARELEDNFHGKSSGIDIIGVLNDHLTYFKKPFNVQRVHTKWRPYLHLSYSGAKKDTHQAVRKINEIIAKYPEKAAAIDQKMSHSATLLVNAMQLEQDDGFEQLAVAINNACQCFEAWQLISDELAAHMQELREHGAVAIKPTGAGGGGYVLSLWNKQPPEDGLNLLPISQDF